MFKKGIVMVAVLGGMLLAMGAFPATRKSERIERGKYLVQRVGLCADCHTPRSQKGELDMSRWLQGAAIEFRPIHPMPWAKIAPPIAGLPTLTDAQAVKFLETGVLPQGLRPRPPMPAYRFAPQDARAVVAYLRSLDKTAK